MGGQENLSVGMLMLSAFGVVVVATSVMTDLGLSPLGKYTLRAAGVLIIAIGLMKA